MKELRLEQLIKARDEIKKHMTAYKKRAANSYMPDDQRIQDEIRSELFEVVYSELGRIIPNRTMIIDGEYVCPNCKGRLNYIYLAADEEKIPVNFCPICGQSFEFLSEAGVEDSHDSPSEIG